MSAAMPDRLPVIPQICHPHAIRALGRPFRQSIIECLRHPSLINKLQLECARMYGVDGVRVADAKKRVGGRVALMGGVNTLLLAHGTLEEVKEDCRRCLAEGAPGGGYILAAGDMLPTETSRDKVEAMVEAAENYRYRREV